LVTIHVLGAINIEATIVGVQYPRHRVHGLGLGPLSPPWSGDRTAAINPIARTRHGHAARRGHRAFAKLGKQTRDTGPR
jgi:hypothetical protein